MQKKVDLIIPGAMKCATTTLFGLLRAHPQMCGSKKKETNFFSTSENWRAELTRYHDFFDPKPGQMLLEASPSYTRSSNVAARIAEDIFEYNPGMKFIYLVRNPRERIVSAYMHQYQRYYTDLNLSSALTGRVELLNASRYYTLIKIFIDRFGDDRVLILDFDDVIGRQDIVFQRIADFLGIDELSFHGIKAMHKNKSLGSTKYNHKWDHGWYRKIKNVSPFIWRRLARITTRKFMEKPKLSFAEQRLILDSLDNEIDQLETLMGKSLQHWKEIGQENL